MQVTIAHENRHLPRTLDRIFECVSSIRSRVTERLRRCLHRRRGRDPFPCGLGQPHWSIRLLYLRLPHLFWARNSGASALSIPIFIFFESTNSLDSCHDDLLPASSCTVIPTWSLDHVTTVQTTRAATWTFIQLTELQRPHVPQYTNRWQWRPRFGLGC